MADRKIKLSVRLGSDQYQHLKRNAEAANMKMEPLIRALIMGADIRPRPPAEYGELLRELAAIGNNLNQLARIANATHALPPEEMGRALAYSRRAWELVKGTL